VREELPRGTVTFLFTDVEGSTRLLHELGAATYAEALAEHRRVLRDACARHSGVEVDTQGDAFFFAFPTVKGALAAADAATGALSSGPIRVRMGVHTGTPLVTEEGYVGDDVHRAARIAAVGHGGQVLVSSAAAALSGLDGLRDLGEHRLKDLSAPERIHQLGDEEFPPLESLYRTNLPVPATPFLGRESELAEVVALLTRDDVRLLTLAGPGGTGKTRLALQAAAGAAERYPDGVWWVPLATLRDPELVLETAAHVLGSKNGLAEHISDRSLLLLFDNFEHVVGAAPGVASLLASCPNVDILVTSRERLRVRGEQTYPVPTLGAGDAETLFVARARSVDPAFAGSEAVAEVCDRLDQLPLAIELAAARTVLFSPEQLLERLSQRLDLLRGERDADPRQQTLRATIEWSYDLLADDERSLLARLSVFAGGSTYDAAEQVVGAGPDALQSLLEKSLLRRRDAPLGARYWMLETIREFAVERLEASGEAEEIRRRHAAHFLALAEEAEPQLAGDPEESLDEIEPEHDNLRAALDFLVDAGETQLVLRLAGALSQFWTLRGHFAEGRRHVEDALAADSRPTTARASVLIAAGVFASFAGDRELERRRAEEALALHGELGDAHGVALARYGLANAAMEGDWEKAKRLLEACVHEFSELGDDFHALAARRGLAWAYEELGELERYRTLTEENLRQARASGVRRIEARSLGGLAMLALAENRVHDAIRLLSDSYAIDRGIGNPVFLAVDLTRFAAICTRRERSDVAARLLAKADVIREEVGYSPESWMAQEYEDTLTLVHARLDEAAFEAAWNEGRALSIDEAVEHALASID
jgi:predicted ATPase/class 3 adenylate cyclase